MAIPASIRAARHVATTLLLALTLVIASASGRAEAQVFGTDWFKEKVEDLLSGGGLEVKIGALEGPLPGAVTLRDVVISDPEGVFLRLPRATLDWSPLALYADASPSTSCPARAANFCAGRSCPPVTSRRLPKTPAAASIWAYWNVCRSGY